MKSCFLKIFLVIFFFASYDVLAKTQPAKKQNSKAKSEAEVLFQKYNENRKDRKLSMKYLKEAAQKGHVEAQYHLGIFSKDEKEREKWLTLSAEAGHVGAMNFLGGLFNGKEDYKKAFFWYQKAAEKGSSHAQSSLGHMYFMGTGVEMNLTLARKWFAKAASAGNEMAKKTLEEIKNVDDGEILFKKAEQQFLLSKYYFEQNNIKQSRIYRMKYYALLAKSSLKGNTNAVRIMYLLGADMISSKEKFEVQMGLMMIMLAGKLGFSAAVDTLQGDPEIANLAMKWDLSVFEKFFNDLVRGL